MSRAFNAELIAVFYGRCAQLFGENVVESRFTDKADGGEVGYRKIFGVILLDVFESLNQNGTVFLGNGLGEQGKRLGIKGIIKSQSLDLFNSFLASHQRENLLERVGGLTI